MLGHVLKSFDTVRVGCNFDGVLLQTEEANGKDCSRILLKEQECLELIDTLQENLAQLRRWKNFVGERHEGETAAEYSMRVHSAWLQQGGFIES